MVCHSVRGQCCCCCSLSVPGYFSFPVCPPFINCRRFTFAEGRRILETPACSQFSQFVSFKSQLAGMANRHPCALLMSWKYFPSRSRRSFRPITYTDGWRVISSDTASHWWGDKVILTVKVGNWLKKPHHFSFFSHLYYFIYCSVVPQGDIEVRQEERGGWALIVRLQVPRLPAELMDGTTSASAWSVFAGGKTQTTRMGKPNFILGFDWFHN